jgi:hypothetical protein
MLISRVFPELSNWFGSTRLKGYTSMRTILVLGCIAAIGLTSCAERDSDDSVPYSDETYTPQPELPPIPNYSERDGDIYHYISLVSEEQRERGIVTGDVISFRYLGRDDENRYNLALVSPQGRIVSRYSCANPCRVIRNANGTLTAFNPTSIIGSAFNDAFAGLLADSSVAQSETNDDTTEVEEPSAQSETSNPVLPIPVSFHGEWNEDLSACGTGLNDSVLVVRSRTVSFYESRGQVRALTMRGANTAIVDVDFIGEGQQWSDRFSMELLDNGNILRIGIGDGLMDRLRC